MRQVIAETAQTAKLAVQLCDGATRRDAKGDITCTRLSYSGPSRMRPGGGNRQTRDLSQLPPLLRHAPARARTRYSHGPGATGPPRRRDDDDLHPRAAPRRTRSPQPAGRDLTRRHKQDRLAPPEWHYAAGSAGVSAADFKLADEGRLDWRSRVVRQTRLVGPERLHPNAPEPASVVALVGRIRCHSNSTFASSAGRASAGKFRSKIS